MDAKLVDVDKLGELGLLDADQVGLAGELLELFGAEASALLEDLHEAVAAADRDRIVLAAHTLKGSAGGIGAARVSAIARECMLAAPDEPLELTASRVALAQSTFLATVIELRATLARTRFVSSLVAAQAVEPRPLGTGASRWGASRVADPS